MRKQLLLFALSALFCACHSTKGSLLPASPFDADVDRYTWQLMGKKKSTRQVRRLETAFQQAQLFDLRLLDSLLEENRSDRWPMVNLLHRRLKQRQEKVKTIQPLRSKSGYEPQLHFVTNITQLETESRQNAANYLYDQARDRLNEASTTGNPAAARQAYYLLQDLKQNYYRYWEDANAWYDEARIKGVTDVLLVDLSTEEMAPNQSFWRKMTRSGPRWNDEWHTYTLAASPGQAPDYVAAARVLSVELGSENRRESTRTESREIEVRQEEKRDTAGHVIERVPVYEHVEAEVREIALERTATGLLQVQVKNVYADSVVLFVTLPGDYRYRENFVYVSGDDRALSIPVMSTIGICCPSAPSDDTMTDRLLDDLQSELHAFLRKQMAGR